VSFSKQWLKFSRFGIQARVNCYTMLESLLGIMDLDTAIRIIYDTQTDDQAHPDAGIAPIVRSWRRSMRNAKSDKLFSSAVEEWVPNLDSRIIAAAETAGDLRSAFPRLIEFTQQTAALRKKVTRSLIWPMVNLGVVIGILDGVSAFLMPLLQDLAPRSQWTDFGALMAAMSDHLGVILPAVIWGVPFLCLASWWAMPRWTGKIRRVFDRYPPFRWYALYESGIFMLEFANLTRAGTADIDALLQMKKRSRPWLLERVNAVIKELRGGATSIGEALYKTGLDFPDKDIVRILRALGADASNKMLDMSKFYIATATERIERSTANFNTGTRAFQGIIVLLVFAGTISVLRTILLKSGVRF
jgi:type II secretory pathway component PulF